ncbi:MAG: hypothetical protein L0Y56_18070, partial [Nitrospira sp.]|nr:hypothetical protein [Nitrospira sp.]
LLVEDGTVSLKSLLSPGQPSETVNADQSAVAVKDNPPQPTTSQELDKVRKEGREGERKLRKEKKK